jgi:cobalt-precorrin-5B (C1)-methyltransferase
MLTSGAPVGSIEVTLPGRVKATFGLVEPHIAAGEASCGVTKDAGDDPDTTDGMIIFAKVEWSEQAGVTITAGEGIGIVTKPGLAIAVGEYAINPVPRSMIQNNVGAIIPSDRGVTVTIYAPEGAERAKKTFNARLGIVGGISILGTTGIVRPMSVASLKASLVPQIDIARAAGYTTVALVPGNMGERVARKKLKFPEDAVIQMSNFVGDMLTCCVKRGIQRVVLVGHIGKIIKVAGGYFDTHSGETDDPVEIMKRLMRQHTRDVAPMMYMLKVNTAEEAAQGLSKMGYARILDKFAEEATNQARACVDNKIDIGTAITVLSGDIVATDTAAKKIVREAKW